jgi:hypothetical protein
MGWTRRTSRSCRVPNTFEIMPFNICGFTPDYLNIAVPRQ